MTVKVIGLIELKDQTAFDEYRSQVGQTVALYKGSIEFRGALTELFWNDNEDGSFSLKEKKNGTSEEQQSDSNDFVSVVRLSEPTIRSD